LFETLFPLIPILRKEEYKHYVQL